MFLHGGRTCVAPTSQCQIVQPLTYGIPNRCHCDEDECAVPALATSECIIFITSQSWRNLAYTPLEQVSLAMDVKVTRLQLQSSTIMCCGRLAKSRDYAKILLAL